MVVPSNRVIVRPLSFASRSSGEVATRSISLPSSASFSLKAFASVTAVAARSALRPRLVDVAAQISSRLVHEFSCAASRRPEPAGRQSP